MALKTQVSDLHKRLFSDPTSASHAHTTGQGRTTHHRTAPHMPPPLVWIFSLLLLYSQDFYLDATSKPVSGILKRVTRYGITAKSKTQQALTPSGKKMASEPRTGGVPKVSIMKVRSPPPQNKVSSKTKRMWTQSNPYRSEGQWALSSGWQAEQQAACRRRPDHWAGHWCDLCLHTHPHTLMWVCEHSRQVHLHMLVEDELLDPKLNY